MSNFCLFPRGPRGKGSCIDFNEKTKLNCGNNGITVTRQWNRFENTCINTDNVSYFDLNMRRKAETLKYKNNSSNLTKNQKYARAARNQLTRKKGWATQKLGMPSNPNTSNLKPTGFFRNNLNNQQINLSWSGLQDCVATTIVPPVPQVGEPNLYECKETSCNKIPKFSSSKSDVPGKPILLELNPDVPLVGYVPVRRTYIAGLTKWPEFGWYPGSSGFPVGKKGKKN